jgi:acyl-CoA synthetase (AMP-forming)/AMP-acid ligase II
MTLGGLLDSLRLQHGDRPALLSEAGTLSFAHLADRANAVALGLARLGAGKGTRIGILMPNRSDWLATAFAAWKLGAVVVPLNTLSRKPELEHALRHADVTILVAVSTFLKHNYGDMLMEICGEASSRSPAPPRQAVGVRAAPAQYSRLLIQTLPSLRYVVTAGDEKPCLGVNLDTLVGAGRSVPADWLESVQATTVPTDVAAIFFTSGTTALPKGVVHTHASMLHAADNVAACLGLTEDDRTWGYLPFFFTGGLVAVALATLSRGGAVLLQEVFDAGQTLELMSQHRCTTLFAWPHQAEALLVHPDFDAAKLYLRKGVGANTKWASRLYPPDHQAVGTWGMTETGPMATATRHDDPLEVRAASHGRAMPGIELRVVDPENGSAVTAGEEGELLVRGAPLMQQYYKVARQDCFDADGFFHTGDLARIDDDGLMHFLGRLKDIIKTAGVNVAAAEVEAVLQQHPAVKVAHVVGVPHPTRGENVAAVIILQAMLRPGSGSGVQGSGSSSTSDEGREMGNDLRSYCSERLASYKVPRHFVFMKEAELPLLGSAKVDKQALRKRLAVVVGG